MDMQAQTSATITPRVVIREIEQLLQLAPPDGHSVTIHGIEVVVSSSDHIDDIYAAWWANGGKNKLRRRYTQTLTI